MACVKLPTRKTTRKIMKSTTNTRKSWNCHFLSISLYSSAARAWRSAYSWFFLLRSSLSWSFKTVSKFKFANFCSTEIEPVSGAKFCVSILCSNSWIKFSICLFWFSLFILVLLLLCLDYNIFSKILKSALSNGFLIVIKDDFILILFSTCR